jgi:hypothetical protein
MGGVLPPDASFVGKMEHGVSKLGVSGSLAVHLPWHQNLALPLQWLAPIAQALRAGIRSRDPGARHARR